MQAYNKIDREIHVLSQIIAKFNRTFIPKRDDDSHTNFYFDLLSRRLYGRWAEAGKHQYCLALHVGAFEFQLINENRISVFEISVRDRTNDELEEKIAEFLPEAGLKKVGFLEKMHYEIPKYDFINSPFKSWSDKEIRDWETIRSLANDACLWMKSHVMADGEIRIWPHHFDTGIYVEPNTKRGLGFGLAMKDPMVNEAYLYYSGYGLNGTSFNYKNLPALEWGRWEVSENWKGAVFPINDLQINAKVRLQTFIKQVSAALLS
ncbi:MAG: hypothetical protein FH748_07905 [Balneolaceae bacterium]|nr:hypothetical protein [Balneolaceae bacterium]